MNTNTIVMIMIVLGAIVTLQFFKGRKINLMIMQHFSQKFEKFLKPKDKLYTWLGGYIGFRVRYDIDSDTVDKIEITLTLLPRHSVLYMPVSLLTARHDKLYIVFRPKTKIKTDLHIIKKGYYILKPNIEEENYLKKEIIEINSRKFIAMYEDRKIFDRFLKRISSHIDMNRVRHMALVKRTNVLFILMKPSTEETPSEVRCINENIEKFIKI